MVLLFIGFPRGLDYPLLLPTVRECPWQLSKKTIILTYEYLFLPGQQLGDLTPEVHDGGGYIWNDLPKRQKQTLNLAYRAVVRR